MSGKLDFVNNLAPLWLAAGAVGSVAALLLRFRLQFAGIGTLVWIGCGVATIGATATGEPPLPGGVHPQALRIVSFNVMKDNPTPAQAAAWIRSERPDIVIVAEASRNADGVVARLAPYFPYRVSCLTRMRCSTVILSRTPPLASGGLARGDPENRKAVSATWMRFADGERTFTVVAVHFQRPWPLGDQGPARVAVAQFLDGIDRRMAIVAGDFNLAPWTFTMARQDRAFALPRLTGSLATWPAPIPMLPIDHVYAGTGWRLVSLVRGPSSGSDHYPLSFSLVPTGR